MPFTVPQLSNLVLIKVFINITKSNSESWVTLIRFIHEFKNYIISNVCFLSHSGTKPFVTRKYLNYRVINRLSLRDINIELKFMNKVP